MTIDALIRKTEAVSVVDVLERSFQDTKKAMTAAQVEQQYKGEDREGKKIGKYKNKAYAAKKFSMNPLAGFGNIDLHLIGDLHKDVFAEVRERSVVFGSLDPKYPKLAEQWPNAWGLNAATRSEYANSELKEAFIKNFKSQLI